MLKNDYIMRMVKLIAHAVAAITRQIKEDNLVQAEALLDRACVEHLGLERAFVQEVPLSQLKTIFTLDNELDVGKCIVAGEIFEQIAILFQRRGKVIKAKTELQKSLLLYLDAYTVLPEVERRLYARKASSILEQLPTMEFAPDGLLRIVLMYEAAGRYSKAEDVLFELVDGAVPGAIELGLDLYQRLLQRKAEELEEGGLPRAEVEQSLQELKARRA